MKRSMAKQAGKLAVGAVAALGLLAFPVQADDKDAAAAMQDLGAMLAAENPEGGGSIRAKSEPDTAEKERKADKRNLQAKVVTVRKGPFPQVALVLRVTKPAEAGPGKDLAKDKQLIVAPVYKMNGKAVDFNDPATVLNIGANFLRDGDTAYVRFDAVDGKTLKATYIERK